MSGPEVRKIFKIRTVRKPDVLLPRRRTFKTFKNKIKINLFFQFVFSICFVCLLSIWWISMKFCYLICKMFKNISPDNCRLNKSNVSQIEGSLTVHTKYRNQGLRPFWEIFWGQFEPLLPPSSVNNADGKWLGISNW